MERGRFPTDLPRPLLRERPETSCQFETPPAYRFSNTASGGVLATSGSA